MEIIVCIKQVPASNKVQTDPETGNLLRHTDKTKMNPYDLFALEGALRLKEEVKATVTVLTMGPLDAVQVIEEAYAMGADRGVLLSDRSFAGADVLATSYTLAQGVKAIGRFDLVICGKQTTDGDTAQVGPSLARWLDIPSFCYVTEVNPYEEGFSLTSDYGDFLQKIKVISPFLITIEKDAFTPRLPSYLLKKKNVNKVTEIWTLKDLKTKLSHQEGHPFGEFFGSGGSATQVEAIFEPTPKEQGQILAGSAQVLADLAYKTLKDKYFLTDMQ